MILFEHLNTLESAGLVSIAQLEPDLEYLFRHALVREAAYASILSADQKKLHLAVGEAIEHLYPDRIDEYAAMLSYHFGAAGDVQKASKYCTLAGEAALATFANQEAENHFRCALGLVNKEAEQAKLYYHLGESLYNQSRFQESILAWKEGIQVYQKLGDYDGIARLYARSARASWYGGDQPEGLRLSQEGLQAIEGMPENPAKAMLIHEAARAYHFNGYPIESERLCRQALKMVEKLNAEDIQADALTTLGVLPDVPPEEAIQSLRQAIEIAESRGMLEVATRAHHNYGVVIGDHRGDQTGARDHFLRAAEFAQERGAAHEELYSLISAAGITLGLGDIETAEKIVSNMREIKDTLTDPSQAALEFQGIEIGLDFLKGKIAPSLDRLREMRAAARLKGDLQMSLSFSLNTVDAYLILDRIEKILDWKEAEEAGIEAVEISNRGVGSSVQALCSLATVHARQGDLQRAGQLYAEAKEKAGPTPTFFKQQSILSIERDIAVALGDWTRALEAAEAVCKNFAAQDLHWPWAYSLVEWAEVHVGRGEPNDIERAWALYRESSEIFNQMKAEFYVSAIEGRFRELRAQSYAVALAHDKVTQELLQAGKIQESFLPEDVPEIAGWQISAILEPARQTSGDFYDFILLSGNRLGLVIADVADKGVGAALYMATCHTLIRTYAAEYPDEPDLVLARANRRILADTHGGLFITVFYAVLDPESGALVYCNAGHNPPFLFSKDLPETYQELSRTGMPLGILEETNWERGRITIDRGDLFLAYTDGVTETQNMQGEFYGEDRLRKAVKNNQSQTVNKLQKALLFDINQFSKGISHLDDMTLLLVRRD